jgi:hypothetical protein
MNEERRGEIHRKLTYSSLSRNPHRKSCSKVDKIQYRVAKNVTAFRSGQFFESFPKVFPI